MMPHVFSSLQAASRFLTLRNVFQGLVHWILTLRNLGAISRNLIPALSPPPPIPTLDASILQNEYFMPSACSASASFVSAASAASVVSAASAASTASAISAISAELIAIETQPSFFSSPVSAFQSSLILATPNQLPHLAIYIFLLLSIISLSLIIFSTIFYFPINTVKISSAITRTSRIFAKLFKTNPIPYLVPASVPPFFAPFQFITCLVSLFILRTGPVRATYFRIPLY